MNPRPWCFGIGVKSDDDPLCRTCDVNDRCDNPDDLAERERVNRQVREGW